MKVRSKSTKSRKQDNQDAKAESPATIITPQKPVSASGTDRAIEVTAKVDVGFGNQLFIRGQGEGLSWDKGIPLECRSESTWVWSARPARGEVAFKLLLNDVVWASGENLIVEPGRRIETVPQFS